MVTWPWTKRRRDKTPAHKINVQSLTASVGEPHWLTVYQFNTSLVDYGVKINETYYRNAMLLQQFLIAMRQISSKFFVFELDSAPAHTALRQSAFFPVTSPDIEWF